MAAQQTPKSSSVSDEQKVYIMFALLAVLAGWWAYQLLAKEDKSSKAKPEAALAASATTTAAAATDTAPAAAPAPAYVPTAQASGADEPTAKPAAFDLTPLVNAIFPKLSRDPFEVSRAMTKLMRKPVRVQDATEAKAGDRDAENPDEPALPALDLQATVLDGTHRYALIDGEIVLEGQTHRGVKITAIREREITIQARGRTLRVTME